eukprot:313459_1
MGKGPVDFLDPEAEGYTERPGERQRRAKVERKQQEERQRQASSDAAAAAISAAVKSKRAGGVELPASPGYHLGPTIGQTASHMGVATGMTDGTILGPEMGPSMVHPVGAELGPTMGPLYMRSELESVPRSETHASEMASSDPSSASRAQGGISGPQSENPLATVLPYGETTGPYGEATGPYGEATGPYGKATGPYGAVTGPYGEATGPYGEATGPYGEATGPYGAVTGPYGEDSCSGTVESGPYIAVAHETNTTNIAFTTAASAPIKSALKKAEVSSDVVSMVPAHLRRARQPAKTVKVQKPVAKANTSSAATSVISDSAPAPATKPTVGGVTAEYDTFMKEMKGLL